MNNVTVVSCFKCQRIVYARDVDKEGLCSLCAGTPASEKSIEHTNTTNIADHPGHGDPSRIDETGEKLANETAAKENRPLK